MISANYFLAVTVRLSGNQQRTQDVMYPHIKKHHKLSFTPFYM